MQLPLIGNERILRNITAMIKNSRLPHAIILEGESGLGKRTLAKFLAKAFLCKEQEKPCLCCKSCHLIDVGTHPDCMFVVPDGASVKVEQIRNLRNEAYLTPMMCNGRVFVIEGADSMNQSSQNALLKVLEEPPEGVCFILLSQNSNMLLPTIRSRCICFTLAPVPLEENGINRVKELLGKQEGDAAALLASADGNIGKALLLAKDDSLVLSKIANEIILYALDNNRLAILRKLQQFVKSRDKVPYLISELKNVLAKEMQKKSVKEYSSFTYKRLCFAYDELSKIEKTIDYNPSLPLVFCCISDCLTKACD